MVEKPPPEVRGKNFQANETAFAASLHVIENTEIDFIMTDPVSGEVPTHNGIV